jgi:hypothetical protein
MHGTPLNRRSQLMPRVAVHLLSGSYAHDDTINVRRFGVDQGTWTDHYFRRPGSMTLAISVLEL